jgi:hypothetical protein
MRHYCSMKRLALVVLCALAAPAAAEINQAESIEWATADCDAIVRGFVTSYRTVELDGTWYEMTFQITESVKGGIKQMVRFAVAKSDAPDPVRWFKDQSDLLLFLVEAKDLVDRDRDLAHFRYTVRAARGATVSVLELGKHSAITRTFAVLEKPTDVLAAVRRARLSSATRSFNLDAPYDSAAYAALYSGSSVWITVPVDDQLEQLGLAWIATRNGYTREQGLAVLERFPTPQNIDRVRRLLGDADPVIRKGARAVLDRWQLE